MSNLNTHTSGDAANTRPQARKQFNEIADDVERHFDFVAGQLREWIPNDGRLARIAPAPKRLPPPTTLQSLQRWVSRNQAAIVVLGGPFVVAGAFAAIQYYVHRNYRRKRRARKAESGARTDVVVVAGAVTSPLVSSTLLDLERRGFIVYVVTSTAEDEQYIRAQSRADLISLHLDLVDPFAAQEQMARFQNLLARDRLAFPEADPHKLNFMGMILAPDTQSAPTRIEDISSEEWSDALNAKVLNTIATTQLFLPSIVEYKAKILFLTPSVTPSLRPPMHAIESTVYGALDGFAATLAAEVRDDGVSISHFKLGNIDVPSVTAKQRRDGVVPSRLKATPLRKLQDSVFDALVSTRPRRTWHVGRGSLAYDMIGSWIPTGVVGWMMGAGRRPNVVEEVKEEELQGSDDGSLTWEKVEQDA